MKVAMMSRILGCLSGVIGMMMVQHVVSGWLMAGTKNGASGKVIFAGNITQLGKVYF